MILTWEEREKDIALNFANWPVGNKGQKTRRWQIKPVSSQAVYYSEESHAQA